MASQLFQNYPNIEYKGKNLRNIMVRSSLIKSVFDKYQTYYPYTIKQGERPDMIAHDYYGSSEYYWVVLMSNYLIDPLFDWVQEETQFRRYIIKKYGSIESAKTTIAHYEYTGIGGNEHQNEVNRITWTMSVSTWKNSSALERSGWSAVYAFDFENETNECRRNIKLISNQYTAQIVSELSSIFKD